MTKFTTITIREQNEHGNGWEATAKVDEGLDEVVSFDIAWITTDDEGNIEASDSVGVLMSPFGAEELSRQLQIAADKARWNSEKNHV